MDSVGPSISLGAEEAIAAYRALKRDEDGLDAVSRVTLSKLERFLYESLTIEQLEGLQSSIDQRGAMK